MLSAKQWDELYEVLDKISAEDLTGVSYHGTGVFSFDSAGNNGLEIAAVKYCLLRRLGDKYDIALTAMTVDGYDQIILNFEFSPK
ncbi:MAG: hypothetical protein WC517_02300 [Patescibacteria group bacterium]